MDVKLINVVMGWINKNELRNEGYNGMSGLEVGVKSL